MSINLYYFRKVLAKINLSEQCKGKTILFSTIRSYPFPLHQELFLANILARKGAKVYVLLDDHQLAHWDTVQIHDKNAVMNPSAGYLHRLKARIILFLYSHRNISILYVSQFLKKGNKIVDEEDKMNIISSVRRFFECGKYMEENPEHKKYYEQSLQNCKIMKEVASELFSVIHPDAVITSHGIYSVWGTLYNYFKKKNVPVFVYGAHAYKTDEIQLTNTLAQTLSEDIGCVKFMNSCPMLSPDQERLLKDYFESRINHRTKDTNCYYAWMNDLNHWKIEKVNKDIKTFAIFPNIIWDGDIIQRDTIFNGIWDWLISTINYFKTSKHNLVVRFHPAEATLWKDSVKLKEVVQKEIPDLYDYPYIFIINSDQPIDTYDFVRNNVDVGLVYDGILTLELIYLGIPVISPAKNRFTGGDFVLSPSSRSEYYQMLVSPPVWSEYFTEERHLEFLKYSYWYFYDSCYKMPIYSDEKFGHIVYNKKTMKKMNDSGYLKLEDKLTSLG